MSDLYWLMDEQMARLHPSYLRATAGTIQMAFKKGNWSKSSTFSLFERFTCVVSHCRWPTY